MSEHARHRAIKHVSFDVWNTIVAPNPAFAEQRTRLLARALDLEHEVVAHAYTRVKTAVNLAAEHEGRAFATADVYARLFASCGRSVPAELALEIRSKVDEMFRRHPPFLAPSARELMRWLRARGITTSIGSNSNFIAGDVMHPHLEAALEHEFEFGVYSDRILHGKPSPAFFERVFAPLLDTQPDIARHQLLHAGDHPRCDVEGARAAGLGALWIESPAALCEQVRRHVEADA